jgi:hypothetical protein
MKRRQVVALLGTVPLAGCVGGEQDALLKLEQSATDGTVEIVFTDLSTEERRVVQTAIDEDFYHACPELPEAIRSLADRIESRDPYLDYRGETYGLWLSITDSVYAMTASPPDDPPSCGIL